MPGVCAKGVRQGCVPGGVCQAVCARNVCVFAFSRRERMKSTATAIRPTTTNMAAAEPFASSGDRGGDGGDVGGGDVSAATSAAMSAATVLLAAVLLLAAVVLLAAPAFNAASGSQKS